MDEIKISNQVSLSDLRKLGREGGATAYLLDGKEAKLHSKFATVRERGFVSGRLQDVEVIIDYPKLYSRIRTIQRNGILVARRNKGEKKQSKLLLTGKGYSPKK
ncbi:hypothetical protein [Streptococcus ovis]|uniref:hypothetical protein n=1 Tax=Streptococcus ovis TaxID=82806 RepID=UPI00036B92AC|nr:hypothetical protein [Streptococcus ovis]